jgi:hypothetical protein
MTQNQATGPDNTAAGTEYTMTPAGTVKLGKTTYTVEIQDYLKTGGRMVWLTGPRGAVYFLRGYLSRKHGDVGHYQVVPFTGSGRPLSTTVTMLGDIIEAAK